MKKVLGLFMVVLLIVLAVGCSKDKVSKEVLDLQAKLCKIAVEEISQNYNIQINSDNFDVELSKELAPNEFEIISDLDGVKKVYLSAYVKGNNEEIVYFELSYDLEKKLPSKVEIKKLSQSN